MTRHLRFGLFLAPFHDVDTNPTLMFRDDLDLVDHLDRLGIDEAWFGEHHSGGWELIACPELMVAAAAERTSRIRLGTGAVSLSYHHPFMLADRIVQLDHMTRGRLMFGVAPGALPSDAAMMCIDPLEQRRMMTESLECVTHLLSSDEPLTRETDWFRMRDARLQLRPFSPGGIELAITAVASPSGPRLAARFGAGLLSVGATTAIGFDALASTWGVMEAESAVHGTTPDRSRWRLTGPIHLADTEAQARADVRYGLEAWVRYWGTASLMDLGAGVDDFDELVDRMNATGFAVIGTPEQMVDQLERLWAQSDGGFGAFLAFGHDWADKEATHRSFELLAKKVAPHFQSSLDRRRASLAVLTEGRDDFLSRGAAAAEAASVEYQKVLADRGTP